MPNSFSTLKASAEHLPEIVNIHCESLPNDFLPGLGKDFLLDVFYPAVYRSKEAQLTVDLDVKGQVNGFIITTRESDKFLTQIIKQDLISFITIGIKSSFKSFKSLQNNIAIVFSGLFSPETTKAGEIYIIAVDKNLRGKGVGKRLVAAAENYLLNAGISAIKIKTLASNTSWIQHFEKENWNRVGDLTLIGKKYVVLMRKL